MEVEQKQGQNIISLPDIDEFKGLPIKGLIPNESSLQKFQKWNSQLLKILNQTIKQIKDKGGCTNLFKVSLTNQWSHGTLSNFNCPQIDLLCLDLLEEKKKSVENDLQIVGKWKRSEQIMVDQGFLIKIFKFYTGSYGSEFKYLPGALKDKINQSFPGHQFYASLNFQVSDILILSLEKIRHQFVHPKKSQQLIFVNEGESLYGLFNSDLVLLNLMKDNNQIEELLQYIQKIGKCSSEELKVLMQICIKIIKARDNSIRFLNNLVGNQEQELSYRENQVQILSEQIKKLLKRNEKSEGFEERINFLERQLKIKEKSIVELNKLISNEEEELIYRENQVQILTEQIKKLLKLKQKSE